MLTSSVSLVSSALGGAQLGLIRVRSLAGGFRSRLVAVLAVSAVVATGFFVGVSVVPAAPANAASVPFDPGYIISDANFYDGAAMSEAQIQAFLAARGSVLANYRSSVSSRAARVDSGDPSHLYCGAFTGGSNLLASTIIHRAQVACGISARVILVTLQKETGLISHPAPEPWRFQRAMGYGCPDSAQGACDVLHEGFGNQVYMASLQFKFYKRAQNGFNFQPGVRYVQYHPNTGCGGTNVNIQSWATAALYNYTPYQPTSASLAAYPAAAPGADSGCGSYGNRNFANFYTEWFGSPTGAVNPIGALDAVTPVVGGATVFGWAFDPDTTNPVSIHVYVNNVYSSTITANQARTDVGAAYPGRTNHGFRETLTLRAGAQSVCLYAINVGPGTINTPLGCRTITVPAPPPQEPPANESGAVYRFWSDSFNGHFYTRSVAERNDIIAKYPGVWKYETVAFGAFGAPVEGTVPVYRFWSNTYNGHFYTTSEAEKNHIIATYPNHIWQYETVAFHVYPNASTVPGTVPMSRFWSAAYGHHFYTASEAEAASVRASYPHIWAFEGQVFRVPSAKPQAAPLP